MPGVIFREYQNQLKDFANGDMKVGVHLILVQAATLIFESRLTRTDGIAPEILKSRMVLLAFLFSIAPTAPRGQKGICKIFERHQLRIVVPFRENHSRFLKGIAH